ncbi:unnamed protein product [Mytilus coruscus]|uniref:B box-type domain-containing protein n=1 Tax=Mytilus coruscus TaxID=42192 RepID=A0A6J8BPM7_MYTCO|nr:unnamed protein product [Mytilus coruscus]
MATSFIKAQSPIQCQLCKTDVTLKWKCTKCELFMCENCKITKHSSEKHRVISVKDICKDISGRIKSLNLPEIVASVFNSYDTDLHGIGKVLCNEDDIVFFMGNCDFGKHKFIKGKLLKASLKVLLNYDIRCMDFSVNNKDEILFAPPPGKEIVAASASGTAKSIVHASPMVILAIHTTKHGELIIGMRDQGQKYPITEKSSRQVAIFDAEYKRKSVFEFDSTGKKLFNYAGRIATDSNYNVYVVDWMDNELRGQIIGMNKSGYKNFSYTGHPLFNTDDVPLVPMDIAVTSNDVIIISDRNNHTLHALNPQGELCGIQLTQNIGIILPYSLSVDSSGFLVIGCTSYNGEDDKAKMFVVKLLV